MNAHPEQGALFVVGELRKSGQDRGEIRGEGS